VSYDGGANFEVLIGAGDPRWVMDTSSGYSIGFGTISQDVPLGTATTVFRFVYNTFDSGVSPGDPVGWYIGDFMATANGICAGLCPPDAVYDTGPANDVEAIGTGAFADTGFADDFTLASGEETFCAFHLDMLFFPGDPKYNEARVRIYDNPNGLINLGSFAAAVPVFDATFSLANSDLQYSDTGRRPFGAEAWAYDLFLSDIVTLPAGPYAFHIVFPDATTTAYWLTAPATGSGQCSQYWGVTQDAPLDICVALGDSAFDTLHLRID
jgi:hypothetical protein